MGHDMWRLCYRRIVRVFNRTLGIGMMAFLVMILLGLGASAFMTYVVLRTYTAPANIHSYMGFVYVLLPIPPYIFLIHILHGSGMALYFGVIATALLASALLALRSNGVAYLSEAYKASVKGMGVSPMSSNGFVAVFTLFSAIMAFTLAYNAFITALFEQPHVPAFGTMPLWRRAASLIIASVWEEFAARVMYIGLPLFIAAILGSNLSRASGMRPIRYLLGGGVRITGLRLLLVLFSSMLFAAGHTLSWDLYKVPPSFIVGLALSYLYLRYGLHYAILLHFAFDAASLFPDVLRIYAPHIGGLYIFSSGFLTGTVLIALILGTFLGGYWLYMALFYSALHLRRFHSVLKTRKDLDWALRYAVYAIPLPLAVVYLSIRPDGLITRIYALAIPLSIALIGVYIILDFLGRAFLKASINGGDYSGVMALKTSALVALVLAGLTSLPIGFITLAHAYSRHRSLF